MLKLLTLLLLALSTNAYAQTVNILIYAGPGVGPKSLANTVAMLTALVADKYVIKAVGPDIINNRDWIADTALLVMPGGADVPYMEQLGGVGNQNIREYVQKGGKYLGICAGAYYAADNIEFAKGDPRLEVVARRELQFYPGLVQGPTYAGFDYVVPQNIVGMRAATIYWQLGSPFTTNQEFVVYYNGGGHFVAADQYSKVTILANYKSEIANQFNDPAAIVECSYGNGIAILSGLHFEWPSAALDSAEPRLAAIKEALLAADQDRVDLAKHLLQRLGIALRGPL